VRNSFKNHWAALILLAGIWAGGLNANAHPYASGITNQSGTVSWVLNELATDVKIIFDNGAVINDLGSAPVVGTNTFSFAGHTNFSISVFKIGSNFINQISSDANIYNSFGGPRGVVVNTNSKTWNFGRIYVANANPITGNSRSTTKGIYTMDAASEDYLGLGNTAALAGMTLGATTTYSPLKLGLGPDDALYVGDAGTVTIAGLWRIDPNLVTASNIFNVVNVTNIDKLRSGTNFGRIIGTPNITGSLAGGNLKLTVTAWDMNVINPAGTYAPVTTNYQDIYQYNIGSGPLTWKTYPSVVTNPISIGTVNTVTMDAQVAPDGKYFITAYRNSPTDGNTNVCVLSSNGATNLWDSKTQSKNYFGDSTSDHCSIVNTSISISPDDHYVMIQGGNNMTFLLMSLTNGVPDISTLTTNNPSDDDSGGTCWASTWDAADNIYVTSGGSDYLRIFSPGLTTTCTTSNDATFTNGSFSLNAVSALSAAIQTQPTNATGQCGGNATFTVGAVGQSVHYQWSQVGLGAISGATNSTLTLTGISLGQSGNSYQVVVSNSYGAMTSQSATLTVIDTTPPVITVLGNATTNIPQNGTFTDPGATAYDACAGTLAVTTNGSVNTAVDGTYVLGYSAMDPSGNSATNYRTVIVSSSNAPPGFVQQPSNQIAQCNGSAIFSVIASGGTPLFYHWYLGSSPLANGATVSGATTPNLTLSGVYLGQSGNAYKVAVTNAYGSTNSQVATLTVLDTNQPVVTLNGSAIMGLSTGAAFVDPGATATDPCAGSLTVNVSGSVNTNTAGTYTLSYAATGPGGVSATNYRSVTVYTSILPAIWTQFPGSPVGDGANGDGTRSDDIYFTSQNQGWASRDTEIFETTNGGNNWNLIYTAPTNAHFRSIGFLTPTHGFAGNLGPGSYDSAVVDTNVLYETLNGGSSWHVFQGLNQQGMQGFCAMHVYDSNTIYGAGRVRGPAFFVKSTNGGTNWSVLNLTAAGVMNGIMDVHFITPSNGWVCGMDTNAYSSSCATAYHGCLANTTNGGASWTPVLTTPLSCCYFWKMAWPTPQVGYVSLQQNGTISSIIFYKTTNGGQNWVSNAVPISVVGGCAFYLQGIGFADTNTGWMGGASCATYQESFIQTTDGGNTWAPIGYFDTPHMNRLRFTATNWGYACGFALHLYSPPLAVTNPPASQIISGGSTAQFSASTYGLSTASYQWLWDGQTITGATNSTLSIPTASRTNEGSYSVVVSNSYGSIISPSATLQVTVPQILYPPLTLASGGYQISFGDSDGSPLSINDFTNLELDSSSNLRTWLPLSLPYSLSNGVIEVNDPTNYPSRYYRVIEH